MGFSRQEHWSRLPFPSPEDLPNPGIELTSPSLAGGFFTAEPPLLDIGSTNAGVDCGWDEVPLARTEWQCLTLQRGSVGDVSWLVYCFKDYSFYSYKDLVLLIYLFMAVLGHYYCVQAFPLVAASGAYCSLWSQASHCGGLSCYGAQALGTRAE